MSVFDKVAVVSALEELALTFNYAAYSIQKMNRESFNKNEFANAFFGITDKLVTFSEQIKVDGEADTHIWPY